VNRRSFLAIIGLVPAASIATTTLPHGLIPSDCPASVHSGPWPPDLGNSWSWAALTPFAQAARLNRAVGETQGILHTDDVLRIWLYTEEGPILIDRPERERIAS